MLRLRNVVDAITDRMPPELTVGLAQNVDDVSNSDLRKFMIVSLFLTHTQNKYSCILGSLDDAAIATNQYLLHQDFHYSLLHPHIRYAKI